MSTDPTRPIALLGISGSIRRASYTTAILRTIAASLPAGVEMTIFPLDEVPIYNEDLEGDLLPASVTALRRAVDRAEGLVVISPEYNHGISGVLKNAVDWVSRPGYSSILKDKPVSVMTVAPSNLGGARAQMQLRETFASTLSRVMATKQVCIGNVGSKVVDGVLVDRATLDFALATLTVLYDDIRLLRLAAAQKSP